jgi:WD40 repeat protein
MRYALLAALITIATCPLAAEARDMALTEFCAGQRPPEIAKLSPAVRAQFEKQIAEQAEEIEIACAQAKLSRTPVHDTADADPAATHTDWNWDAKFTPDGRHIVSAGKDLTLRLWDVASGRQLRVIARFPTRPLWLAIAPDGKRAAVSIDAQHIAVIDIDSGKEVGRIPPPTKGLNSRRPVEFDGAGRLIAQIDEQTVGIFPPGGDGTPIRLDGHAKHVLQIAVSDTARLIATGDDGGTVYLWELETGRRLDTIKVLDSSIDGLGFAPDGSKLAIGGNGKVFIRDVAGRQTAPLITSKWRLGMHAVAFTRDGKGLITARTLPELWNAATGEKLRHFGPFNDLTHSLALSPDGKYLLTTHIGSDLRLWEIETGTFFRRFGRDVHPPR